LGLSVMVGLLMLVMSKTIVSPLWAAAISPRSEPSPAFPVSEGLVTVSLLGTSRPSSASSWGRKRGVAERRWARPRGVWVETRFRSQEKNDMRFLLLETDSR